MVDNEIHSSRMKDAIIAELLPQFQKFGGFLRERGFNTAASGNLSVRRGSKMYITRRGSLKGDLQPGDIVETNIDKDDSAILISSTETYVHRNILRQTPGLATIHCHPPFTVVVSLYYTMKLNQDYIIPIDVEGNYLLKKIPIITLKNPTGSKEMEEEVAKALENYNIMILNGHGVFSRGPNLAEAYNWITIVEEGCQLIYRCLQLGIDVQAVQGKYEQW